jgi:hypothetical protein
LVLNIPKCCLWDFHTKMLYASLMSFPRSAHPHLWWLERYLVKYCSRITARAGIFLVTLLCSTVCYHLCSSSEHIVSVVCVIVTNEMRNAWKDMIVAHLEMISWHIHGGIEENHESL